LLSSADSGVSSAPIQETGWCSRPRDVTIAVSNSIASVSVGEMMT